MDKFPITMLLVMVYLLTSCEGWPESGKYFYICSDESAETCLASSASNNNVEVKSLSLHWKQQQHFVWKIDKVDESWGAPEWRIENLVGGSDSSKKFLSPRPKRVVELSSNGGDDLQRSWSLEAEKDQSWLIQNNKVVGDINWCLWDCLSWQGQWLYKDGGGMSLNGRRASWADCEREGTCTRWYFVQVQQYQNLGLNPGSTAMSNCEGDCDSDNDCADGWRCYERPYYDCKTDCAMPKQCFIGPDEKSYAGPGAWDPCISDTEPVVLPFEAPQPSDGGKYYFVFDSNWVAAVGIALAVLNLVVMLVWCTRSRGSQTKKVVYKMVDVESEAEDLK